MLAGLNTFIRYSGRKLPYDAEIEYLESTGTQWIDSGVPYDHTVECEMDFAKTANTASSYIFGIYYGPGDTSTVRLWAPFWSSNRFYPHFYTTTTTSCTAYLANGVRHTIKANATTFTFDSTTISVTSSTFDPTIDVNIFISARNVYSPVLYPNVHINITAWRIFSFKIWKSGVLVRDFIPVRKGSVGYMYDRVSGKLFGNQGTDNFILGPDKN